jgi:hypothetical protein
MNSKLDDLEPGMASHVRFRPRSQGQGTTRVSRCCCANLGLSPQTTITRSTTQPIQSSNGLILQRCVCAS